MADGERWTCLGCGAYVNPPSQVSELTECAVCGSPHATLRNVGAGKRVRSVSARKAAAELGKRTDPSPELFAEVEALAEQARAAIVRRDKRIIELHLEGYSMRKIGAAAGLSAPAILNIVRRDYRSQLPSAAEDEAF